MPEVRNETQNKEYVTSVVLRVPDAQDIENEDIKTLVEEYAQFRVWYENEVLTKWEELEARLKEAFKQEQGPFYPELGGQISLQKRTKREFNTDNLEKVLKKRRLYSHCFPKQVNWDKVTEEFLAEHNLLDKVSEPTFDFKLLEGLLGSNKLTQEQFDQIKETCWVEKVSESIVFKAPANAKK